MIIVGGVSSHPATHVIAAGNVSVTAGNVAVTLPHVAITPSTSTPRLSMSASADMPKLFNWNPRSSVGQKRKSSIGLQKSGKKKKKTATCTHMFVCLATRAQDSLSDGQERASLQMAGLGEKKITFLADSDAQDIYRYTNFHVSLKEEASSY